MRSKERVLMALDHREPDRVPLDYGAKLKDEAAELTWKGDDRDAMISVCEAMLSTETWTI